MTIRVERFVASLALACLCNCATTKPDSTDSPSSLIDLPEQQKQNEGLIIEKVKELNQEGTMTKKQNKMTTLEGKYFFLLGFILLFYTQYI